MALPTAAQVRSFGLPQITGTDDDALLTGLVSAADQMLAAWCLYPHPDSSGAPLSHTLETASYVLYLDGPSRYDSRRLDLFLRPIGTISSVTMDDADDGTYSTTVSSSDYAADKHTGSLRLLGTATTAWSEGPRRIKVSTTAGSNTGATPALLQAICLQVAHLAMLRRSGAVIQSVSTGQSSQSYYPDAIAPIVKALLAPYYLRERERQG